MPYKDKEEQREAVKFAVRRYREKLKQEAEATHQKFEENISLTPENLNYGMEPTKEKALTWDEYQRENLVATKDDWVKYKLKFFYDHQGKAEQEKEEKRKRNEERSRFNTSNHDCVLWRRMYSKGQKSDFLYNHIDQCKDCMAWYARQKNTSTLDLNDTKDKQHFEELDGYASAFKPQTPYPEDFVYGHGGVFPMTRICPICGSSNLRPNGSCLNCSPQADD